MEKPMKQLLEDKIAELKNKSKHKDNPKSERHELIGKFTDRLNSERGSKYKPLSYGFIASKLATAKLKTNHDLYWFYAYCNQSNNFSATFWYSLKPKK